MRRELKFSQLGEMISNEFYNIKKIAKIFLMVPLILSFNSNIYSQKNPGTIYFVDGTSQVFTDFESIHEVPFRDASTISNHSDGLLVSYQNSTRTIPFGNLKTIIIVPEKIIVRVNIEGELDITTKNGINFRTPITIGQFRVYIWDELTNNTIIQYYNAAIGGKQITSRIEFD